MKEEFVFESIKNKVIEQLKADKPLFNCAMLLSLGYIREATTYAESCGGGGSPVSDWGRDKDENDEHWWRRCIAVLAAMMRPAVINLKLADKV